MSGVEQSRSQTVGSGELYGRRFTIEERFRDIKDWRFEWVSLWFRWSLLSDGIGCSYHRACADPASHSGAAGEALGMSRLSKPTPSNPAFTLVSPGQTYSQLLLGMPEIQSEKSPPPFPRITASDAKTPKLRPTVANVPSRNLRGSVSQPAGRFCATTQRQPVQISGKYSRAVRVTFGCVG